MGEKARAEQYRIAGQFNKLIVLVIPLLILLLTGIFSLFYRSFAELAFEFDKPRVILGLVGCGSYLLITAMLNVAAVLSGIFAQAELSMWVIAEAVIFILTVLINATLKKWIRYRWKKEYDIQRHELIDDLKGTLPTDATKSRVKT